MKEINGLVRLHDLDSSIAVELRYASDDNFLKKAMYSYNICIINKETGKLLIKANEIFKREGFQIKVWDAYRPLSVQKRFYEIVKDPNFVAKPVSNQLNMKFRPGHNNGMAVDITLIDSCGNELEMPSEFDDFSEKASPYYTKMSQQARENSTYLIEVMESVGFKNYSKEWWHFNDIINTPREFLDIGFEEFDD